MREVHVVPRGQELVKLLLCGVFAVDLLHRDSLGLRGALDSIGVALRTSQQASICSAVVRHSDALRLILYFQ